MQKVADVLESGISSALSRRDCCDYYVHGYFDEFLYSLNSWYMELIWLDMPVSRNSTFSCS